VALACADLGAETRLILLGTAGGPTPKRTRAAPSQALVVDGSIFLVDCGNGVGRQMALAGLSFAELRHVFLTHHHSDHAADLVTLPLLAWAANLEHPLTIHGPPPVRKSVRAGLRAAAFDIRTRIAAAINGVPAVKALNERAYERYRRYGHVWNPDDFKLAFTDGVLIYSAIKGGRPNPRGTDPMLRQPNITVWSGTTEAPDEPAYGPWLKLVAQAGLVWDKAMLDYLAGGKHEVERKREPFWGGATLSLSRARPPKPAGKE